jgi:hypothetical protein
LANRRNASCYYLSVHASVLVIAALVVIVAATVRAVTGSQRRYAEMTEGEFEEQARRARLASAGILGFEKIFDPKKAEFLLQQGKQMERNQSPSGDRPDTSAHLPSGGTPPPSGGEEP